MDMRCPKCNSLVKQGDAFCIVCGTQFAQPEVKTEPLLSDPVNSNIVNNSSNVDTKNVVNSTTNLNVNSFPTKMSIAEETFSDDNLINAYMGKNADKLKDGSFSWCYFFFGQYYLLYRKLWVPFFVINIISSIVDKLIGKFVVVHYIVTILFSLLICGAFKSFYLRHVTAEVESIKAKNPNVTNQELIKICAKKGGTSWGIIVLYFVLLRVLVMI